MRWASSGVPVHLVSLSFQPHAPLSRLVLLSCLHSFVLCARTCTLALTLALRLPSGRRVCVCNPWNHRDPFGLAQLAFFFSSFYHSRGAVNLIPSTAQRRRWFEIVKREGTPSCVPAIFQFSAWREAKPRTSKTWYFMLLQTRTERRQLVVSSVRGL